MQSIIRIFQQGILASAFRGLGLRSEKEVDYAYKQRDIAALMAAKSALLLGYKVSFYWDGPSEGGEDLRNVLVIHYDEGQVSWHLSKESAEAASRRFPRHKYAEWDGTDLSKLYSATNLITN